MLGFNKVFVLGNLTRDPELRYTPNGQAVASFGVATNRRWSTPEGEKREEVEFHNLVVWGRQAETINQYLKKGQPIFIEGRLKTQNWEGPDGIRRTRTEIIVESFQFIGGFNRDQSGPSQAAGYNNPSVAPIQNDQFSSSPDMISPSQMAQNNPASSDNSPVMPNIPSFDNNPPAGNSNAGSNISPDEISIDDIPF
ncbi:MAG: single-stranded DNA-binding protein [Patescibacteria group bacterium]